MHLRIQGSPCALYERQDPLQNGSPQVDKQLFAYSVAPRHHFRAKIHICSLTNIINIFIFVWICFVQFLCVSVFGSSCTVTDPWILLLQGAPRYRSELLSTVNAEVTIVTSLV